MNNNTRLLEEYFGSEESILVYLKFSPKKNLVGIMFVEADEDVEFWSCLINTTETAFEIFPASNVPKEYQNTQSPTNGKATLIKLYPHLHRRLLVGVDGDMEYIVPSSTRYAHQLCNNQFIMHTFSYGMESVIYNEPFLNKTVENIKYYDTNTDKYNIIHFLEHISEILYTTFLYYVTLYEKQPQSSFRKNIFNDILEIRINKFSEMSINADYISALKEKCKHINHDMLRLIEEEKVDHFLLIYEKKLRDLNITKKNIYKFISSHTLDKKIIRPLLQEIHSARKRQAIVEKTSKPHLSEKQKKDIKNQINSFFKKECTVEGIIFSSKRDKHYLKYDDEIIKKIIEKYDHIKITN